MKSTRRCLPLTKACWEGDRRFDFGDGMVGIPEPFSRGLVRTWMNGYEKVAWKATKQPGVFHIIGLVKTKQ